MTDPLKLAMVQFAEQHGWIGIETASLFFLAKKVHGQWRGTRVVMRWEYPSQRRDKSTPGEVYIRIRVGGRRFSIRPVGDGTIWTRPISLFGPRVVEPDEVPGSIRFYVAARDLEPMRRLFRDPKAVEILGATGLPVEWQEGWLKVNSRVAFVDTGQGVHAWLNSAYDAAKRVWRVASTVARHVKET